MGNVEDVGYFLRSAWVNFRTAEVGLGMTSEPDPNRVRIGLGLVATYGRAVTGTLQRLRSRVDGFDAWYGPYVEEMASDPLMRWMWEIRNATLKEGVFPEQNVEIRWTNIQLSASGPGAFSSEPWNDPESIQPTSVAVEIVDAPTEHRGKHLPAQTAFALAEAYLTFLYEMLTAATDRFAPR